MEIAKITPEEAKKFLSASNISKEKCVSLTGIYFDEDKCPGAYKIEEPEAPISKVDGSYKSSHMGVWIKDTPKNRKSLEYQFRASKLNIASRINEIWECQGNLFYIYDFNYVYSRDNYTKMVRCLFLLHQLGIIHGNPIRDNFTGYESTNIYLNNFELSYDSNEEKDRLEDLEVFAKSVNLDLATVQGIYQSFLMKDIKSEEEVRKIISSRLLGWRNFKMPEQITGPINLTVHYHRETDKMFYIFGDVHMLMEPCKGDDKYLITNALRDMFTQAPYFIDFVVEEVYSNVSLFQSDGKETSYLDHVRNLIEECTREYRVDCTFSDTVRIHYNDLRQSVDRLNRNLILSYDDPIFQFVKDGMKTQFGGTSEEKIAFNKKWGEYYKKNKIIMTTKMFQLFKINKQKDNVPEKYRTVIFKTFDTILREETQEFTSLGVLAIFMDLYTILRCFRTFKQKPNTYSKEMKNIVIYAGNLHSNNYRRFLTDLGAIRLAGSGELNSRTTLQCIQTGDLPKWFTRPRV